MSCGQLWLGDCHVKAIAAARELRTAVALVTVTAPGQDVLPFTEGTRAVDQRAAREWNLSAPARWSEFHAAARAHAVRVGAEHGVRWRLIFKAWELQKRGVLHLHLVVPAGSPGAVAASEAYVKRLAKIAHWYGFGFVDRGKLPSAGARQSARQLAPCPPHRAAGYIAGYLASTGAGKGGIAEVARSQGSPGSILYVAPFLSRRSGVTMRSLRDRRRIASRWPQAASCGKSWRAACVLDAMERGRPPLSAEARGSLLEVALAQGWGATLDATTGELRPPTLAPPPGQATPPLERQFGSLIAAQVRLDLVLHRDDGSAPWELRTEATPGALWTFGGA